MWHKKNLWERIQRFFSSRYRKETPLWIQMIVLVSILIIPSFLRFAFQRNDWKSYTDPEYAYQLEYPAHLFRRVNHTGLKGNQQFHLLLYWPAGIDITHQIYVGEASLISPTPKEVATFAEERIHEKNGRILNELETIEINGHLALTRTYYNGRRHKEVYLVEGERGYIFKFSASSSFYESSLQDFEQVIESFHVLKP